MIVLYIKGKESGVFGFKSGFCGDENHNTCIY